jgi:hypothetical protein
MLQADDERQGDCLFGLVAGFGFETFVRNFLEQKVWVGLKPERLVPPCRLGHLRHSLLIRATSRRA